ncbi:hypothetical protein I3842_15G067300 [Carya illinoinensis]|uniref:Uncharacterized protein n=1 Tax=Carya illinoinensis TaxID=32201 RepID=A0A922ABX8_CARIL|nr:hypothetical protein I3842_15G067300 [Carya illinoinensis]
MLTYFVLVKIPQDVVQSRRASTLKNPTTHLATKKGVEIKEHSVTRRRPARATRPMPLGEQTRPMLWEINLTDAFRRAAKSTLPPCKQINLSLESICGSVTARAKAWLLAGITHVSPAFTTL